MSMPSPVSASASASTGAMHVVHPAQLGDHLRAVGAVAQHLAVALVEVAEGAVAAGHVLDHVDQHRRRGDAGHGTDRVVLVAGLQRRSRRTSPAPRRSASSLASPSKISAPMIAPRSGPDARSQVIGGPACSSRLSRMPGITSRAVATPVSIGRAEVMRSTAISLARSISIMIVSLRVVSRSSSWPEWPSSIRCRRPAVASRPGSRRRPAPAGCRRTTPARR